MIDKTKEEAERREKYRAAHRREFARGNQYPKRAHATWTPSEDRMVLVYSGTARELSFILDRSMQSIRARKQVLLGKTGDMGRRAIPSLRKVGPREQAKIDKLNAGRDPARSNLR